MCIYTKRHLSALPHPSVALSLTSCDHVIAAAVMCRPPGAYGREAVPPGAVSDADPHRPDARPSRDGEGQRYLDHREDLRAAR